MGIISPSDLATSNAPFADAIEIVPKTLAENAGLDVIDTLMGLRKAHTKKGTYLFFAEAQVIAKFLDIMRRTLKCIYISLTI